MLDVSRNAAVMTRISLLGPVRLLGAVLCAALLSHGADSSEPKSPGKIGRVVIVENSAATVAFEPRLEIVRQMLERGMEHLAQTNNATAAWQTFVAPTNVIGLKVYSAPGGKCGTRPALVAAVIEGLLAANVPRSNIIVWDKHRSELRHAGFFELGNRYGVLVEGAADAGWDKTNFYQAPLVGQLIWGDLEFGSKEEGAGRKSFVTKLITRKITKIINISPLLNHNSAGVCGSIYSVAMGSVDNTMRFENDPARLATSVPEIYAMELLGDKVALNIVDALICQYQGEEQGLLHYSTALNELRLSQDPLALDLLSLQELDWQRKAAHVRSPTNHMELYQNAALLDLGAPDLSNIRIERVR